MVRAITGIAAFVSLQNHLKQGAQYQPLVKGVVKAQLNPLPESTHVVISEAGRRKQAAEAFKARLPYDLDI